MRRFLVTYTGAAVIQLDDSVISAVDDEWRSVFYNLNTPEEIVEHIGLNLVRGVQLSQLDGWADLPDDAAQIVREESFDVKVIEER